MQASYPLIEVYGFDINKICRDIIEDISEDDVIDLSVVKPLRQINNFIDMVIRFTLINAKQFEDLGATLGLINQNVMGNSSIVLAKRDRR
jgi:hypothetical protein